MRLAVEISPDRNHIIQLSLAQHELPGMITDQPLKAAGWPLGMLQQLVITIIASRMRHRELLTACRPYSTLAVSYAIAPYTLREAMHYLLSSISKGIANFGRAKTFSLSSSAKFNYDVPVCKACLLIYKGGRYMLSWSPCSFNRQSLPRHLREDLLDCPQTKLIMAGKFWQIYQ